jgi:hypothetical protein
MGITVNNDLAALQVKVEELEAQLKVLQDLIFEAKVLELEDDSWDVVREKRDYLIRSSDWTMTPGSTVDQAAWAAYRQVLRDLPQTFVGVEPANVVWPKKPSASGPNTIEE